MFQSISISIGLAIDSLTMGLMSGGAAPAGDSFDFLDGNDFAFLDGTFFDFLS
jgi:hypothetical protein